MNHRNIGHGDGGAVKTAPPAAGDRELTAHHEPGHAVAAVMRGGGELVSITIEPTDDYLGHTETRVKPWAGRSKREATWSRELEDDWPVITAVAELLLAGEHVDHATVEGLPYRHSEGAL